MPVETLHHNIAPNMETCIRELERLGKPTFPKPNGSTLYCNATWDSVLCWPATPANSTVTLPCPPLKGLDPTKNVRKLCHASGLWAGRNEDDFSKPSGWTDFSPCFPFDQETLEEAQAIARGTRKLEFVGLGLSFCSLIVAVAIFCSFRRLRVFRNQIHLQLMVALLMVVVIRLVLYIDLVLSDQLGNLKTTDIGATINTTPIVCESFYFLLEYFKTVAFAWMFIEGFYLHNTVVVTVFADEPKLKWYLLVGYGVPLVHASVWLTLFAVVMGKLEKCLGYYYLNTLFWLLDGPRLAELVINFIFLLNIVRVLWLKVKHTHSATESEQLKKSVKAALMLVPLLGIPNVMQTIPFTPTQHNIMYFRIYTYIASFFYMFQGFMIAIIYCFTNREVINVLKSQWERFKLRHTSIEGLRRGSRAASDMQPAMCRNGPNYSAERYGSKSLCDSPLLKNGHTGQDSSSMYASTLLQPVQAESSLIQYPRTTGMSTGMAVEAYPLVNLQENLSDSDKVAL